MTSDREEKNQTIKGPADNAEVMREALESLSEQPQALTPSQVMGHRSHEADSIHPADLADHLENLSPEERRDAIWPGKTRPTPLPNLRIMWRLMFWKTWMQTLPPKS